jgi:outer membrane murein-binding lipoprotein Lpp
VRLAVAAVVAMALLAGCNKPKEPKVDAATEREQATERAKQGPYGTQVQALDKAKGMESDINNKAESNLETVDKMSK